MDAHLDEEEGGSLPRLVLRVIDAVGDMSQHLFFQLLKLLSFPDPHTHKMSQAVSISPLLALFQAPCGSVSEQTVPLPASGPPGGCALFPSRSLPEQGRPEIQGGSLDALEH